MKIILGVLFFMAARAIFGERAMDAVMYGIIIITALLFGIFFFVFVLPSQTWQGMF
jgi:hypothetical protein